MKVQRIVANVEGSDFDKARDFYQGIFGLDLLMDLGWINTFGSKEEKHKGRVESWQSQPSLIKPCEQFSRTRLSDTLHTKALSLIHI